MVAERLGRVDIGRRQLGTMAPFPNSILNVRSCHEPTCSVCPIHIAQRLQLGSLQTGSYQLTLIDA